MSKFCKTEGSVVRSHLELDLINIILQECPSCDRDLAGRNVAMERIATLVFSSPDQPGETPGEDSENGAAASGGAAGGVGGASGGGPSAPPTE